MFLGQICISDPETSFSIRYVQPAQLDDNNTV